MYKQERKRAGLSIEEAAFQLHVAPRTLCTYEAGKTRPSPETVLAMTKVYRAPALVTHYCRSNCAIGSAFCYVYLNNVDRSPQNILLKLHQKFREVQRALDRMSTIAINKQKPNDFSETEIKHIQEDLHDLMDLEHIIQVLKVEMEQLQWVEMPALVSEHNNKCYQKGYVVDGQVKEAEVAYGKTNMKRSVSDNRPSKKAQMICSLPPPGKPKTKMENLA